MGMNNFFALAGITCGKIPKNLRTQNVDFSCFLDAGYHLERLESYCNIASNMKDAVVYIETGSFDKSKITGQWENMEIVLNAVSIIYDRFIFNNCDFITIKESNKEFPQRTWIDLCEFNNCKFKNCEFTGDMRWVKFKKCTFENVKFNLNYIRETTFHSDCKMQDVKFNFNQVDQYWYIQGKRCHATSLEI